MLGSRCLAFSTSSSTERWPVCEKNVSTIRSRCRVDLSPRAAIQLARRSRAAVEIFFGAVRFILKLILSLENSTGPRAGRQGACRLSATTRAVGPAPARPRAPARRRARRDAPGPHAPVPGLRDRRPRAARSEEHTSELQSLAYLVCRLLLEK